MSLHNFLKLFNHKVPAVIGMIHVGALPGTPLCKSSVNQLVEAASNEALIYSRCGVDGVLVENMHDIPYVQNSQLGPEIAACMTRIASEVRRQLPQTVPLGVQVLAGGNAAALAVALAAELQFVRVEGYVFAHVADEGWMDGDAGRLLRYRRNIGARHVSVFCDVKKKHCSHAVTGDLSVAETARAAEFFLADGVIVTGTSTGRPADPTQVAEVRDACSLPVLVGSGVTADNLDDFQHAHGLIVGSEFKRNGRWTEPLCRKRILRFMDHVNQLRS